MVITHLHPLFRCLRLTLVTACMLAPFTASPAAAQALAAVVNGDPITTVEVDEMMKFGRLARQPMSRGEAVETLIADRLKLRAANREGIDATDASLNQTLNRVAAKANISASGLLAALQGGKANLDIVRTHLRSVAAWSEFVKARHKALSVRQDEVDAALSKNTVKGDTDYTLQQIVLVVPIGATPQMLEQRLREAQALRSRFQDCATGVPLARALPNVAVKPQITRAETALSDKSRSALSQVQKGRLTVPDRTANGIEMVAVCNKDEGGDRTSLRDNVQATLLTERLATEADKMYADLRATAVVEKR